MSSGEYRDYPIVLPQRVGNVGWCWVDPTGEEAVVAFRRETGVLPWAVLGGVVLGKRAAPSSVSVVYLPDEVAGRALELGWRPGTPPGGWPRRDP